MKIGIIGAGKLGRDIFNYLLDYDFFLTLICKREESTENLAKKTNKKLDRARKAGIIDEQKYNKTLENIKISANLDNLKDSDIIIEAISEDLTKKKKLFNELKEIIKDCCIICTNSSSFTPSDLIANYEWQDRFIGLHFFYPVKIKKIVELIKTKNTSKKTIDKMVNFLATIKKFTLHLDEENAFLLNKVYLDIQALAYHIYEEGILTFREIDEVIKSTLFPIGIFEFIDSVGADIMLAAVKNYIKNYKNKEFYSPLLNKLEDIVLKNSYNFYSCDEKHSDRRNVSGNIEEYKDEIINKTLYTLINSSLKAVEKKACSEDEIEYSMREYLDIEKGPIAYSKEIGLNNIYSALINYYNESNQDIFYPSKILKT